MLALTNLFSKYFTSTMHKENVVYKKNYDSIIIQLKDVSTRLRVLKCLFNLETNFDLIESYIAEINALEKKYSYLIKQAKIKSVS